MEEQGNDDVEQQKKVKFEEKSDEQAPAKKETKENKEHKDEEDEEEDSLVGKSDDDKHAQNDIKSANTEQEKNKTSAENNIDKNDGLGNDLEMLEAAYKREGENNQTSKNELDKIIENKNENPSEKERKTSTASKKSDSVSDEEKAKLKKESKTVEFDRVSNASGYSLNSRRSNGERSALTETAKSKSPEKSNDKTPKRSQNKSPIKKNEKRKVLKSDDEDTSDFRTSVESLSSGVGNPKEYKIAKDALSNTSDDYKSKEQPKEVTEKNTVNRSNTSLRREPDNESKKEHSKDSDKDLVKEFTEKSETDMRREPVKVLYGEPESDLKEPGQVSKVDHDSPREESGKTTNAIDDDKQSSKQDEGIKHVIDKDDPQYQVDEDGEESTSYKSKKVNETKVTMQVTVDDTKPSNNEEPTKPVKEPEPRSVTVTTKYKKPPASTASSSVNSSSNQSYPRPSRTETMSPRDIVAEKRKERRQQSQSARYPSQSKSSARDATMATRTSSRASTFRSSRPPSRARTALSFSTERRRKEREFFHAELQRLKDSLRKESKKIKKPKVRDHYPDVFTSLAPYFDTYTANFLIKMPELGYKENQPPEVKKQPTVESEETHDLMYTTRCTAIGLCDPCVSLSMDRNVLPKLETAEIRRKRIEQMHAGDSKPKSGRASSNTDRNGKTSPRQKRPEAKQGSTRLPKFPVIAPPNSDLTTKELHYGDVPMLRDEMIKSFSHYGEGRKKSDYDRTKQDFYRMELDRLDEYHHTTRPHMRAAYFAYLQNTPGSRKAIYDCMKDVSNPKKKEEQSPQAVA
ncbi:DNA ligase 1-like isoform X2 [Ruditapes philippinarum]|uniref:DNA ligase 1-like isoform X2 n=1 Tax=Ruditapes philippinarum TaxID=129788 RepID=UPI00295B45F3|nr:DNA ligase 1-like isoform X2 [Ruditapes philippinarum]